jgi:hypothetical protein
MIAAIRHCEERSDEAIQGAAPEPWIAAPPAAARDDVLHYETTL